MSETPRDTALDVFLNKDEDADWFEPELTRAFDAGWEAGVNYVLKEVRTQLKMKEEKGE